MAQKQPAYGAFTAYEHNNRTLSTSSSQSTEYGRRSDRVRLLTYADLFESHKAVGKVHAVRQLPFRALRLS